MSDTDTAVDTANTAAAAGAAVAGDPPAEVATEVAKAETSSGEAAPGDEAKPAGVPKWVQSRIDAITRDKWEHKREADQLRQQLEQLKRGAAAGANGNVAPEEEAAVMARIAQQPASPLDIEALASRKAQEMLQQQDFDKRCNDAYKAGVDSMPDFKQAIDNFGVFGGLGAHRPLLEAITANDGAHKVLHYLGTNLEETSRILSLPPMRQAIEVTRLSAKLATQMPPVSKAPPPVNPIGGAASEDKSPKLDENGESKDQEAYRAWRKANFKRR